VAFAALPPLRVLPRLLDVGSCGNYFGLEHASRFEVTALDLAPAHSTVFACDFLELEVGPPGCSAEVDLPSSTRAVDAGRLLRLPSGSFDIVVLSLFLSYFADPAVRGAAVAKARRLLRPDDRGLLIVADSAAALGRFNDPKVQRGRWVDAVEGAGFRLLKDPQMHFSRLRDRATGVMNRAACFSFATTGAPPSLPPLPIHFMDAKRHRPSARPRRRRRDDGGRALAMSQRRTRRLNAARGRDDRRR